MEDELDGLASDLHSAALHLLRRLRQADRETGITPARLSALSAMVYGGPCTISKLADVEQVAGPTMSRIVTALVDAELAERRTNPADGRSTVVAATEKGRGLLERGRRQRVQRLAAQLGELTENNLADLRKAVTLLRSLEG